MTDKVDALPPDQFAALWNAAASLDEAAVRMREVVGIPCPRWAVMARAGRLRTEGAALKTFPPGANPGGGGGTAG